MNLVLPLAFTLIFVVSIAILVVFSLGFNRKGILFLVVLVSYFVWSSANWVFPQLINLEAAQLFFHISLSSLLLSILFVLLSLSMFSLPFENIRLYKLFFVLLSFFVIMQIYNVFQFNYLNFNIEQIRYIPYLLALFLSFSFSSKIVMIKYRGMIKESLRYLILLGGLSVTLLYILWGFEQYNILFPFLLLPSLLAFSYPFIEKRVGNLGQSVLSWSFKFFGILFVILFFSLISINLAMGGPFPLSDAFLILVFLASSLVTYIMHKFSFKGDFYQKPVFLYLENKIAGELKLGKLGLLVSQYINSALGVRNILILVFDEYNTNFKYKTGEQRFRNVKTLDMEDVLEAIKICQDYEKKDFLTNESLSSVYEEVEGSMKKQIQEVMRAMKADGVEIIVPLNRRLVVNGVVLIGGRESGEPFSFEDYKILERIVQIASVAFGRAILYQEVEELSRDLRRKVQAKTKKLRLKIEKMEEMRQRERDLIDIMGHELRTPLTIAKNSIEMLEMYKDGWNEDSEKFFEYLKTAVYREMAIVEMLLSATKLDAGKIEPNLQEVLLVKIVENSKLAFEKAAVAKGLKFEINLGKKKDWNVKADPLLVQQVLDNLVSNAVKYTHEGYVKISLKDSDSDVGIFVEDSGEGLEEKDIARLGEKFYRAKQYIGEEDSKNSIVRPGGAGLGLYVAFGLVSLMNGRYEVESKKGNGSVFKVFFTK